ncbi:endonuclease/exonuclease/phosphatase family protein [Phenylobacterium sp.]|jgi:endonuclease/exonuclease/phosphatase (EEP) superfamily protein YafD|uniref:endonuclease/exonuclease/phosphatase family protein n=1 Tax=Phenylobacterium sp. TaxID=1871053 RepID=UPI002F422279
MRSLWRVLCWILEALAWALALIAAAAAVGAHGGRWNAKLDLLTHPALAWLAGGAAAFVLSWFSPSLWRGWTIRALSLVALAAALGLLAPDLRRPSPPPTASGPQPQIKLIEFNAWERNRSPQAVARWIAAQDPDIVVVIEPSEPLKTAIDATTNLHTFMANNSIIGLRHKPIRQRVAWDAHELAGRIFFLNWPSIYGFDGKPFDLLGVHIDWPIPARKRRAEDLHLTLILDQEDHDRAILAGDFNSAQWSFRQQGVDGALGLERRDRLQPTWPALIPQLHGQAFPGPPFIPIDHIYAGSLWRTVKVERGPRLGSDHYPLIATLAWTGPVGGDPKLWPNAR